MAYKKTVGNIITFILLTLMVFSLSSCKSKNNEVKNDVISLDNSGHYNEMLYNGEDYSILLTEVEGISTPSASGISKEIKITANINNLPITKIWITHDPDSIRKIDNIIQMKNNHILSATA